MKESTKERGAINLATLLLILICVVIVIVCLVLVLKMVNGKNGKSNSQNNSSSIVGEPKTLDDYKKIAEEYERFKKAVIDDRGEEYVQELTTFDNVHDYVTISEDEEDEEYVSNLSQDEIKKAIEDYLNIYNLYNNNVEKLLVSLNLTTQDKLSSNNSDELLLDEFHQTDINYEDFKNEMLKYMTSEVFLEEFSDVVRSVNGKVYYSDYAVGSEDTYQIKEINIDEDDSNYYVVKIHRISNEIDTDIDDITEDDGETEVVEDVVPETTEAIEQGDGTEELNADSENEFDEEVYVRITSKNKKAVVAY